MYGWDHNRSADWFDRIPKVELHLHLEGAIPLDALWILIEKYGGDRNVPTRESLREKFTYSDFPNFIDTWVWKNGFLREYEDFTFIAEAVARDLAAQNIRYAEVFYSPGDFRRHGLQPAELTVAIRRGLDRVAEIDIALVADLIRDFGPDRGGEVLDEVIPVRDQGVVGIGIGGSEHQYPPGPFADVYSRARRSGFRTSAHAGEAAGPESVEAAIRLLEVDRIGHGTRAAEDPRLVEYMIREEIPVELCPWSNVRTAVIPSIDAHPAGLFFREGMRISVNSDDPKMLGTSVAGELRALTEHHQFTADDIRKVLLGSISDSWLDAGAKEKLIDEFRNDPAWRGGPHGGMEPPMEKDRSCR